MSKLALLLVFLLGCRRCHLFVANSNVGAASCVDVDPNACVSMAKQNPTICSDQSFARTACPVFCNICQASTTTTNTTIKVPTPPNHTQPTSTTTPPSHSTVNNTLSTISCRKDIILIVESTRRMQPYFGAMKDGIINILNQIKIGPFDNQLAVGTFRSFGHTVWELNSYQDKQSLIEAVHMLSGDWYSFNSWATNLAAVEYALREFHQGNRRHVPDVLIIASEAHSHNYPAFWLLSGHSVNQALSDLHNSYDDVITIAAGAADVQELHSIATDSDHFFYKSDTLAWTTDFENKLIKQICA